MMRLGLVMGAAGVLLLAGCASSGVTQRQSTAAAQELARPQLVIVYDFAGTRADLPPDSVIARYYQERSVRQTVKEVELGRQLGRLVAQNLVGELNKAGITAQRVAAAPVPRIGDAVIRGEFIVANEGSRLTRVLIGFGAGKAELKTLAEAYQVTATGLVPLGSAQIEAAGGKLPGMLVPVGIGAAAGTVVTSAAISGASNLAQEVGPETIAAAAERTAKEISKLIVNAYKKRGWL
jgi:Domain of unknown function (DUF4410)